MGRIQRRGAEIAEAEVVALVLHGRDQDPGWMVDNVVAPLEERGVAGVSWVLPGAPSRRWYTGRIDDPVELNRPELEAAKRAARAALPSIELPRVVIGFSQGACLGAELLVDGGFAAGALLTGGLLGRPGSRRTVGCSVRGVPVLVAAGRSDPWMPTERFDATVRDLSAAGADVEVCLTDDGEHVVRPHELDRLAASLAKFGVGGRGRRDV